MDDDTQARGSRQAYERYLRGMDASMRQKVALTAAHLLCTGRVADMGMGSGAGSEALAALYPRLEVTGVDLDPMMVSLANEKYRRENLSFVQGDIAERLLPDGSLDGIFDSSVLHHVTSFGGYDHARAAVAIGNQVEALRHHGVLLVRDFLAPPEASGASPEVLVDLRDDDGDASDDPRRCSTASLFVRFATREFRSLASAPGFSFREEPSVRPGTRRFRATLRMVTELVLRKDYRDDWESEAKEEYAYFTQEEFLRLFARLGLRVLASTPLRNPWIVRNRLVDKVWITSAEDGRALPMPATNYVIAGEKVSPGEGVSFREEHLEAPRGFLVMEHHRDARTGALRDLVRRPHASIDVVPFFREGDDLFVVARMSYPRPILAASRRTPSLDESTPPTYTTEPLGVMVADKPLGQTVEEMLARHANIGERAIRAFFPSTTYYPSPGGSQEEVRSVLVEVDPVFIERDIDNVSGFAGSGRIRAIEAEQVLRAAQVGGLPDARLELAVHDLLARTGRAPGPWIGDAPGALPKLDVERTTLARLAERPPRRVFTRSEEGAGFLELVTSRFEELDASGASLAKVDLEYVVPARLGTSTIAVALLAEVGGAPCIAVEDDDLPAAQCFDGSSALLVAPAWRLPAGARTLDEAKAWVLARVAEEYDVDVAEVWELGGPYHPSAGMAPEVVFPLAVGVKRVGARGRSLAFVPLSDVRPGRDVLRDGHLRLVALRAAHALGALG